MKDAYAPAFSILILGASIHEINLANNSRLAGNHRQRF
jgi:hypothetical protein